MSRFADGGNSALLAGKDLEQLVLEHVGWDPGREEEHLANHSPFISFSQDLGTAFTFSAGVASGRLSRCELEDATCFVWELQVERYQTLAPGHYTFTFVADPVNCIQIVEQQLYRAYLAQAATGDLHGLGAAVMNAVALQHADADQTVHTAELVDVVSYLRARDLAEADQRLVANALARASRDREWLLRSLDPMPDGPGLSSRFPMNRHLRVSACYRLRS